MAANINFWVLLGYGPTQWPDVPDQALREWADRLRFTASTPADADVLGVLGAPTIQIEFLDADRRVTRELLWRGGRVSSAGRIAIDAGNELLRWVATADRQRLETLGSLFQRLSAPVPVGTRRIKDIPPGELPECGSALPDFLSGTWQEEPGHNNCYNYANDVAAPTDPWPAIPGRGGGQPISRDPTREQLREALERDGLTHLDTMPEACGIDGHFVAAIVRPSEGDFHCFRLNQNGLWSHKDGPWTPRNADDDHREITDLAKAVFHYEFEFAGYYFSGPDTLIA